MNPTQPSQNTPFAKLLRLKQVIEYTGIARSTVYNLMNPKSLQHDSSFPKSIQLTQRTVVWVVTELDAWIATRVAKSRKVETTPSSCEL